MCEVVSDGTLEYCPSPHGSNRVDVALDLHWDGFLPGWEDDGCPHQDSNDLQWDGYFPAFQYSVNTKYTCGNGRVRRCASHVSDVSFNTADSNSTSYLSILDDGRSHRSNRSSVRENAAILRARARALLKVDTELSILTHRTRKLLREQRNGTGDVEIDEAKGSEKCGDWLSTDGHHLVTTQHTSFECRSPLCQHQSENNSRIKNLDRKVDDRQRHEDHICSLLDDSGCRYDAEECEEQRGAFISNKIVSHGSMNTSPYVGRNNGTVSKFHHSVSFDKCKYPSTKQNFTPRNNSSRPIQKSRSSLCSNVSDEFYTATDSISKQSHSDSPSNINYEKAMITHRKRFRKYELGNSPFLDFQVRKSVSFSDQMLNRNHCVSIDEEVYFSPNLSHSDSFVASKDTSIYFSPCTSLQYSPAVDNLSSVSLDVLKDLDMDDDDTELGNDEFLKGSRIYRGKHSLSIGLFDSTCREPQSSPSTDSFSEGRLSDHSDFRTCSTCSCLYVDDVNNDLFLDSNTCRQIDQCSERADYMYHIAPIDACADEVWASIVPNDDHPSGNSIEQLIAAYRQCDAVYRMSAESSVFAPGDNPQCDANYVHTHSVQTDMVEFGRGDSPFVEPSQMSVSFELLCEPPQTETCTRVRRFQVSRDFQLFGNDGEDRHDDNSYATERDNTLLRDDVKQEYQKRTKGRTKEIDTQSDDEDNEEDTKRRAKKMDKQSDKKTRKDKIPGHEKYHYDDKRQQNPEENIIVSHSRKGVFLKEDGTKQETEMTGIKQDMKNTTYISRDAKLQKGEEHSNDLRGEEKQKYAQDGNPDTGITYRHKSEYLKDGSIEDGLYGGKIPAIHGQTYPEDKSVSTEKKNITDRENLQDVKDDTRISKIKYHEKDDGQPITISKEKKMKDVDDGYNKIEENDERDNKFRDKDQEYIEDEESDKRKEKYTTDRQKPKEIKDHARGTKVKDDEDHINQFVKKTQQDGENDRETDRNVTGIQMHRSAKMQDDDQYDDNLGDEIPAIHGQTYPEDKSVSTEKKNVIDRENLQDVKDNTRKSKIKYHEKDDGQPITISKEKKMKDVDDGYNKIEENDERDNKFRDKDQEYIEDEESDKRKEKYTTDRQKPKEIKDHARGTKVKDDEDHINQFVKKTQQDGENDRETDRNVTGIQMHRSAKMQDDDQYDDNLGDEIPAIHGQTYPEDKSVSTEKKNVIDRENLQDVKDNTRKSKIKYHEKDDGQPITISKEKKMKDVDDGYNKIEENDERDNKFRDKDQEYIEDEESDKRKEKYTTDRQKPKEIKDHARGTKVKDDEDHINQFVKKTQQDGENDRETDRNVTGIQMHRSAKMQDDDQYDDNLGDEIPAIHGQTYPEDKSVSTEKKNVIDRENLQDVKDNTRKSKIKYHEKDKKMKDSYIKVEESDEHDDKFRDKDQEYVEDEKSDKRKEKYITDGQKTKEIKDRGRGTKFKDDEDDINQSLKKTQQDREEDGEADKNVTGIRIHMNAKMQDDDQYDENLRDNEGKAVKEHSPILDTKMSSLTIVEDLMVDEQNNFQCSEIYIGDPVLNTYDDTLDKQTMFKCPEITTKGHSTDMGDIHNPDQCNVHRSTQSDANVLAAHQVQIPFETPTQRHESGYASDFTLCTSLKSSTITEPPDQSAMTPFSLDPMKVSLTKQEVTQAEALGDQEFHCSEEMNEPDDIVDTEVPGWDQKSYQSDVTSIDTEIIDFSENILSRTMFASPEVFEIEFEDTDTSLEKKNSCIAVEITDEENEISLITKKNAQRPYNFTTVNQQNTVDEALLETEIETKSFKAFEEPHEERELTVAKDSRNPIYSSCVAQNTSGDSTDVIENKGFLFTSHAANEIQTKQNEHGDVCDISTSAQDSLFVKSVEDESRQVEMLSDDLEFQSGEEVLNQIASVIYCTEDVNTCHVDSIDIEKKTFENFETEAGSSEFMSPENLTRDTEHIVIDTDEAETFTAEKKGYSAAFGDNKLSDQHINQQLQYPDVIQCEHEDDIEIVDKDLPVCYAAEEVHKDNEPTKRYDVFIPRQQDSCIRVFQATSSVPEEVADRQIIDSELTNIAYTETCSWDESIIVIVNSFQEETATEAQESVIQRFCPEHTMTISVDDHLDIMDELCSETAESSMVQPSATKISRVDASFHYVPEVNYSSYEDDDTVSDIEASHYFSCDWILPPECKAAVNDREPMYCEQYQEQYVWEMMNRIPDVEVRNIEPIYATAIHLQETHESRPNIRNDTRVSRQQQHAKENKLTSAYSSLSQIDNIKNYIGEIRRKEYPHVSLSESQLPVAVMGLANITDYSDVKHMLHPDTKRDAQRVGESISLPSFHSISWNMLQVNEHFEKLLETETKSRMERESAKVLTDTLYNIAEFLANRSLQDAVSELALQADLLQTEQVALDTVPEHNRDLLTEDHLYHTLETIALIAEEEIIRRTIEKDLENEMLNLVKQISKDGIVKRSTLDEIKEEDANREVQYILERKDSDQEWFDALSESDNEDYYLAAEEFEQELREVIVDEIITKSDEAVMMSQDEEKNEAGKVTVEKMITKSGEVVMSPISEEQKHECEEIADEKLIVDLGEMVTSLISEDEGKTYESGEITVDKVITNAGGEVVTFQISEDAEKTFEHDSEVITADESMANSNQVIEFLISEDEEKTSADGSKTIMQNMTNVIEETLDIDYESFLDIEEVKSFEACQTEHSIENLTRNKHQCSIVEQILTTSESCEVQDIERYEVEQFFLPYTIPDTTKRAKQRLVVLNTTMQHVEEIVETTDIIPEEEYCCATERDSGTEAAEHDLVGSSHKEQSMLPFTLPRMQNLANKIMSIFSATAKTVDLNIETTQLMNQEDSPKVGMMMNEIECGFTQPRNLVLWEEVKFESPVTQSCESLHEYETVQDFPEVLPESFSLSPVTLPQNAYKEADTSFAANQQVPENLRECETVEDFPEVLSEYFSLSPVALSQVVQSEANISFAANHQVPENLVLEENTQKLYLLKEYLSGTDYMSTVKERFALATEEQQLKPQTAEQLEHRSESIPSRDPITVTKYREMSTSRSFEGGKIYLDTNKTSRWDSWDEISTKRKLNFGVKDLKTVLFGTEQLDPQEIKVPNLPITGNIATQTSLQAFCAEKSQNTSEVDLRNKGIQTSKTIMLQSIQDCQTQTDHSAEIITDKWSSTVWKSEAYDATGQRSAHLSLTEHHSAKRNPTTDYGRTEQYAAELNQTTDYGGTEQHSAERNQTTDYGRTEQHSAELNQTTDYGRTEQHSAERNQTTDYGGTEQHSAERNQTTDYGGTEHHSAELNQATDYGRTEPHSTERNQTRDYGRTEHHSTERNQTRDYGRTGPHSAELNQATDYGRTEQHSAELNQTTDYGRTEPHSTERNQTTDYGRTEPHSAELNQATYYGRTEQHSAEWNQTTDYGRTKPHLTERNQTRDYGRTEQHSAERNQTTDYGRTEHHSAEWNQTTDYGRTEQHSAELNQTTDYGRTEPHSTERNQTTDYGRTEQHSAERNQTTDYGRTEHHSAERNQTTDYAKSGHHSSVRNQTKALIDFSNKLMEKMMPASNAEFSSVPLSSRLRETEPSRKSRLEDIYPGRTDVIPAATQRNNASWRISTLSPSEQYKTTPSTYQRCTHETEPVQRMSASETGAEIHKPLECKHQIKQSIGATTSSWLLENEEYGDPDTIMCSTQAGIHVGREYGHQIYTIEEGAKSLGVSYSSWLLSENIPLKNSGVEVRRSKSCNHHDQDFHINVKIPYCTELHDNIYLKGTDKSSRVRPMRNCKKSNCLGHTTRVENYTTCAKSTLEIDIRGTVCDRIFHSAHTSRSNLPPLYGGTIPAHLRNSIYLLVDRYHNNDVTFTKVSKNTFDTMRKSRSFHL